MSMPFPENSLENEDKCDPSDTHHKQYFGRYLVYGVHNLKCDQRLKFNILSRISRYLIHT